MCLDGINDALPISRDAAKSPGEFDGAITAIAKMQSGPNSTCSTDLRSHKYIQQTYQE